MVWATSRPNFPGRPAGATTKTARPYSYKPSGTVARSHDKPGLKPGLFVSRTPDCILSPCRLSFPSMHHRDRFRLLGTNKTARVKIDALLSIGCAYLTAEHRWGEYGPL